MDLIDEQDGAQVAMDQTLIGFRDDLAQIRHRAADGRDLHERSVRGVRDHASERGLPGTCGSVEDDGRERVVLDRRPKPGAFADRLLLPDQLVERARTHTHGKRRVSKARFIFHLGKERIHGSPLRIHSSASLRRATVNCHSQPASARALSSCAPHTRTRPPLRALRALQP